MHIISHYLFSLLTIFEHSCSTFLDYIFYFKIGLILSYFGSFFIGMPFSGRQFAFFCLFTFSVFQVYVVKSCYYNYYVALFVLILCVNHYNAVFYDASSGICVQYSPFKGFPFLSEYCLSSNAYFQCRQRVTCKIICRRQCINFGCMHCLCPGGKRLLRKPHISQLVFVYKTTDRAHQKRFPFTQP